jgi:hypothetical protein
MALMINGRVLNSEADLFREMGSDNKEIAAEIHVLAHLMHGETDWSEAITAEEEESFRVFSPEAYAAYGSLANFRDDYRSQSWQGEMSSARHFYREAAEWYEQNNSARPFIELSKAKRLAGLTAYAEHLHRQGSTRAFTRLAHIAQL